VWCFPDISCNKNYKYNESPKSETCIGETRYGKSREEATGKMEMWKGGKY
jgi:hypothetical protein